MISVERDFIDVVSGGKITAGSNIIEEVEFVTRGINVAAVNSFCKKLQWESPSVAWAIGTTIRTLERHKKENKRLSASISENALELARLSTIGTNYFGNVDRWNAWLNMAHVQFNNLPPKSFINTIRGRELIKRVILSLEHGFTA